MYVRGILQLHNEIVNTEADTDTEYPMHNDCRPGMIVQGATLCTNVHLCSLVYYMYVYII